MEQGKVGLIHDLRKRMEQSPEQAISFCDYMNLCLYHPDWGYYSDDRPKLGKDGDFYTSASVGSLMGECLAEWVMSLPAAGKDDLPLKLIEWGGGSGKLAKDVLDTIQSEAPKIYERVIYHSIERSPYHRKRQAEMLAPHIGRVRWLTEQEWAGRGPWNDTVMWSNELIDALPVHRIVYDDAGWQEVYVAWDSSKEMLQEKRLPLRSDEVLAYIAAERIPERSGQYIEVNLSALHWLKQAAEQLASGWLLTIDYGDTGRELYASHRMAGTLMCYRKHQASDTPFMHPGEQDITAHVNFSALIREGELAGLQAHRLLTQKQFLVEHGLLGKLQNHDARDPFSEAARRNRAIRQLLLSDQMSELFKVLIQEKR